MPPTGTAAERALLVALEITGSGARRSRVPGDAPPFQAEESMAELATLTKSAGAVVVDSIVQSRPRADAATLIGSGKVE